MLATIFGVPGSLTAFGVRVVQTIMKVCLGSYDVIHAQTLDELREAWRTRQHAHQVYFSETHSADIPKFFVESRVPIVVFADDPARVALDLAADRKLDLRQAIRDTSIRLAALEEAMLTPAALIVHAHGDIPILVRQMIERMALFFGIVMTEEQVARILDTLLPGETRPGDALFEEQFWRASPQPHVKQRAPRTDEDWALAREVLGPFAQILEGRRMEKLEWPVHMFMKLDNMGEAVLRPVDLTGRSRHFIYGPYLGLPQGQWLANIAFEIAANRSPNELAIIVTNKDIVAEGRSPMPRSGLYASQIAFEVQDPRWPMEIRFGIAKGAIEGTFELKRVALRRLS